MNIGGMHSLSTQWLSSTRIDWYILPPNGCQDATCIGRCLFQGGIAVNGADAEQIQSRVVGSEEDGECILI